jgi:hypothetical protein
MYHDINTTCHTYIPADVVADDVVPGPLRDHGSQQRVQVPRLHALAVALDLHRVTQRDALPQPAVVAPEVVLQLPVQAVVQQHHLGLRGARGVAAHQHVRLVRVCDTGRNTAFCQTPPTKHVNRSITQVVTKTAPQQIGAYEVRCRAVTNACV